LVPGTKDTDEFAAVAQNKEELLFKFVLAQGYKFVELQSWWFGVFQEQPYPSEAQMDMRPLLSVRSSN
jgi:hypothetical protein